MKPTKEEIEEARQWFGCARLAHLQANGGGIDVHMLGVLLAATAPPDDIPRPDDMAELARLVAAELRDRAVVAHEEFTNVYVLRPAKRDPNVLLTQSKWHPWSVFFACFDNLTPREIANAIHTEERRRAREWAGDE